MPNLINRVDAAFCLVEFEAKRLRGRERAIHALMYACYEKGGSALDGFKNSKLMKIADDDCSAPGFLSLQAS